GDYYVQLSTGAMPLDDDSLGYSNPSGWAYTGTYTGTPGNGNSWTEPLSTLPAGTSTVIEVRNSNPLDGVIENIVNVNFGIQRLPEAATNLQPEQMHPGYGMSVQVPSSAFVENTESGPGTEDHDGGIIVGILIRDFPSGADSIVINDVTYTRT